MTPDLPRVAAIVVVHHVAAGVEHAVRSVLQSNGVSVRVIVVDNDSSDPDALTALAARAEGDDGRIQVLQERRNGGFAAGVNAALGAVETGEYVLLLNDDATVDPECLRTLADTLHHAPDAVSAAPLVTLASQPDHIDSFGITLCRNGEAFNTYIGQEVGVIADLAVQRIVGPCFAVALFRPGAFEASGVGPLNEDFFLYYEDVEWNVRALRRGWTSIANPRARAQHQHAASTRQLGEAARYQLVQRNLLMFVTLHFPRRHAGRAWSSRLLTHAKGLITGPYRRQRLMAVGAATRRLPTLLAARRRWSRLDDLPVAMLAESPSARSGPAAHFDTDTLSAVRPETTD